MAGPDRTVFAVRWIRWAGVLAAAVAVVAVIVVLFGPVTDLIARHDAGPVTGPGRAVALQSARDAARGRLLQLGAGLFAAAALIYTARTFTLSREGQVTDRYTKAVEQLGSSELDVRVGGIYALERIAHDSARDHPTVMEVLAAFIREHSREQWPPPGSGEGPSTETVARMTRPDVQAALTVIGRRDSDRDRLFIDLTGADLTGANLSGANLAQAVLRRVNFRSAILYYTTLRSALLNHADFTGAYLIGANFTDADLTDADWPSEAEIPRGWQRDARGRLQRSVPGPGG